MPSVPLNGTELYYEETGGGLPCLVMHGGLGLDLTSMQPSLDPLADALRLSELHTPTLILAGRDDFITPPHQAERLAATLPRARLIVFERSGQYPWIEEPDQFFPIVHGWLAETQV